VTNAQYPADTRAKGWRFEIDVERIEQSDTWTLAPFEVRPWLLMLWMTAWKQTPCGTLTDDDTLIAARIGMPAKAFAKHRQILMRGWWLADDGRLYHPALTERVEAMLVKREKDAGRTAARRARTAGAAASPPQVTQVSRMTPDGLTGEFDTKHQAPSTRDQKPEEKTKRVPALTVEALVADGLTVKTAEGWVAHRRAKGAKLTELAWNGFKAEVLKAPGWTLEAAVLKAIARNWTAFEASWVASEGQGGHRAGAAPMDTATRNAEAARLLGFHTPPEDDHAAG
jgi:hypothetical protein